MELDDALSQISEIRRHLANSEVFRGYRSATTLFSGAVALLACGIQLFFLPADIDAYLYLWLTAALVSLCVVGAEMIIRCRRSHSALQREMTMMAVEQFVPCMVAAGLLTYVMLHYAYHSIWMLPGLWSLFFGVGVFSSRRVLPKGTFIVGAWYLLAGILCIVASQKLTVPAPGKWLCASASANLWQRSFCIGTWSAIMAGKSDPKPITKTDREAAAGRFAYEGLERLLHEKARLSILSSLASHVDGLVFNDLKAMCTLTDGNLSRQLQVLQEASLVEIIKGYKNNRPQTLVRLTPDGRERFLEYIAVLESVVSDALGTAGKPARKARPFDGLSPA